MRRTLLLASLFATIPAAAQEADPPDLKKESIVYLVSTAHLDTQWRWTIQDTIDRFLPNTLRGNFRHFEAYDDYTFSFEGAFRYKLAKEYYPDLYEELKGHIERGNWRVAGSWLDAVDTNLPSPEALIRHTLHGNGFFRKEFGQTSRDVFLPDCFGFGHALPSIAHHCGLRGFSTQKLTWGSAMGIPHDLCRWEGPDGSSIIAALNAQSYVAGIAEDISSSDKWQQKLEGIRERCGIAVDFHYFGVGDQGGAVDPDVVEWVRKSVEGKGPVKVIHTGSDQLFRDLHDQKDALQALPTYTGELLMTAHGAGCYTSQAVTKRWNRKCELLADAAERASVIADWLGGATYPDEKLREAWVRFLWHGFHDDLTGTSIPQAYVFSWNDYILSLNQFAEVLTDAVGAVSRSMDTQADGMPIVVFNPLSIEREDVVDLDYSIPMGGAAPIFYRVFGPDGNEVPAQWDGDGIVFLARIPSVGFAVYDVRRSDVPTEIENTLKITEDTLESDRYRVRIDANGDMYEITDKINNRNLLSGPARIELHDNHSPRWPAWEILYDDVTSPPREYVEGPADIKILERGPARVSLEITRQASGSVFVQTIRLAAGEAGDRIDIDTEIYWNSVGTLCKQAFPWSFSSPTATYDLGLGTIDRPNNTEKMYEVPAQQWAAVTAPDGTYGAAVLNDCRYGWDKPDDSTLRLTLIHTPRPGGFQDQATQDIGRHRLTYSICGYEGDWRDGNVPWKAARLNQPLLPFSTAAHDGPLGKTFSFLKTGSDQVAVRAIKKAEESEEIIVRLQELHGRPADGVFVDLAGAIKSTMDTNGAEEGRLHLRALMGKLVADFTPYQPRTYALQIVDPHQGKLKPPTSAPIPLDYDLDVVSFDGEASDIAPAYPAELFPETLTMEGIRFSLGPTAPGEKNAVACRGQEIPIPEGEFNQVYVLAAANGGEQVGDLDFRRLVHEYTGNIGQWDSRVVDGEYIGNHVTHGLAPGFVKRTPVAWVGTHRHDGEGKNESYLFCYMFKYALHLERGAKTITLPENENIWVFAVTFANNPNTAGPARDLYDRMEFSRTPPPTIHPPGGEYTSAVRVEIHPFLIDPGAEIRYTLDGSEPTKDSPVCHGNLVIGEDAVLKACILKGSQEPGYIATAEFKVRDTTRPSLLAVSASEPGRVLLTFSEILDRVSAEDLGNYHGIQPLIEIKSATLLEDGVTVELRTSPMEEGRTYTLTLGGMRDASEAGHVLQNWGKQFVYHEISPEDPILHLPFDQYEGDIAPDASHRSPPAEVRGARWLIPSSSRVKRALEFDGQGVCVIVADQPWLNPRKAITIAAWIKAVDWKGNRRIVQKGVNDGQYRLLHEGGRLRFHLSSVGMLDTSPPSTGEWHHVAGTYDGKEMRIYVDGKLAAHKPAKGNIAVTADPVYIGTKTLGVRPGDFFKGAIDEVRIYDRALSADEIVNLPGHGDQG